MMSKSTEKRSTRLRQQASVQAEVARSRLALAYQDAEDGNNELALRRSVEAAFDAGVAQGYAKEAKQEKKFNAETKDILAQAQALSKTLGSKDICDGAYKAGSSYAKARSNGDDGKVQKALAQYEGVIDEVGVGRMANPGSRYVTKSRGPDKKVVPVRKLKSKLLR